MNPLEAQRNAAKIVHQIRAHVENVEKELNAAAECQLLLEKITGLTPHAEAAIVTEIGAIGEYLVSAIIASTRITLKEGQVAA